VQLLNNTHLVDLVGICTVEILSRSRLGPIHRLSRNRLVRAFPWLNLLIICMGTSTSTTSTSTSTSTTHGRPLYGMQPTQTRFMVEEESSFALLSPSSTLRTPPSA